MGETVDYHTYADIDERRLKAEKELKEFKDTLRDFICEKEPWAGDIEGEDLLEFAVKNNVGIKEPYNIEKHGQRMQDEWGLIEGDEIYWFGNEGGK